MTSRPTSHRTALLLSFLVMPGLGHWHLGLRKLGSTVAALTAVALLYPLAKFAGAFQLALETALAESTSMDMIAMISAIAEAWQAKGAMVLGGVFLAMVLWIGAGLDILRRRNVGSS